MKLSAFHQNTFNKKDLSKKKIGQLLIFFILRPGVLFVWMYESERYGYFSMVWVNICAEYCIESIRMLWCFFSITFTFDGFDEHQGNQKYLTKKFQNIHEKPSKYLYKVPKV